MSGDMKKLRDLLHQAIDWAQDGHSGLYEHEELELRRLADFLEEVGVHSVNDLVMRLASSNTKE